MTDPELDGNRGGFGGISRQEEMEEERMIQNNVANIENRIDQKLKEIDRMMGKTVDDEPKQELQI